MSTLVDEIKAHTLIVTDESLALDLADGRTISVPLHWYPRLVHATPQERNNWRWIGDKEGVHWPELDEDISIENFVFGKPSGESQESFRQWLEKRKAVNG